MRHHPLLILLLGLAVSAHGQATIHWFTFDSAGGTQSSADYQLRFTAGQADAGSQVQTSAAYRVTSGFWAVDPGDPTPSLPSLSIVASGANVILSWPAAFPDFVLQQTDSLDAAPSNWFAAPGVVNDSGSLKSMTLPQSGSKRFYRLRRP